LKKQLPLRQKQLFEEIDLSGLVENKGIMYIWNDQNLKSRELETSIRNEIGAIACFKQASVVKRLPKTRSGKILRGTMRKIANGEDYKIPSTIDDPEILSEIEVAIKEMGYAK